MRAAVSTVGSEFQKSDPSIWRWHVSSILDAQKTGLRPTAFQAVGALDPGVFQRHERYSPLGVPDAGRSP